MNLNENIIVTPVYCYNLYLPNPTEELVNKIYIVENQRDHSVTLNIPRMDDKAILITLKPGMKRKFKCLKVGKWLNRKLLWEEV